MVDKRKPSTRLAVGRARRGRPYSASAALTIPATSFPSARPAVFGPIAFMTLPMSLGPENPPSSIASRTS
jgi:hypothetical protein